MAATTSTHGNPRTGISWSIIQASAGVFVVGNDGAASRMAIRAADYRPHG